LECPAARCLNHAPPHRDFARLQDGQIFFWVRKCPCHRCAICCCGDLRQRRVLGTERVVVKMRQDFLVHRIVFDGSV